MNLPKKHKFWGSKSECSNSSVIQSQHYQADVRHICVNCSQIKGKKIYIVRMTPMQLQMDFKHQRQDDRNC